MFFRLWKWLLGNRHVVGNDLGMHPGGHVEALEGNAVESEEIAATLGRSHNNTVCREPGDGNLPRRACKSSYFGILLQALIYRMKESRLEMTGF